VLAAYTFGDVIWSMIVFFLWILWFWMLFSILGDLFSRHDIGGWAKTGWCIFVICLPFLGIFVYLIAEGHGMAKRTMERAQAQQSQMDSYVRSVASSGGSADEIAKAKQLLDSGAITQDEFTKLKAQALGA
jgi:hypothetical protein